MERRSGDFALTLAVWVPNLSVLREARGGQVGNLSYRLSVFPGVARDMSDSEFLIFPFFVSFDLKFSFSAFALTDRL
jgi:hypothetical protein